LKHVGANSVTSVTAYVILYSYIQVHNLVQIKSIQNYNFVCHFVWVCETWSLTLRWERRIRVFDNRLMRSLFGCKSNEVTGE